MQGRVGRVDYQGPPEPTSAHSESVHGLLARHWVSNNKWQHKKDRILKIF